MLTTPIADRRIEDRFLEMTPAEQALYDAVEDYITSTYNQASANERTAVGFVMTIYRRRLASSFHALRKTLQNHLDAIISNRHAQLIGLDEDVPDDEAADEVLDVDDVATLEREALAAEEESDIGDPMARHRGCSRCYHWFKQLRPPRCLGPFVCTERSSVLVYVHAASQ